MKTKELLLMALFAMSLQSCKMPNVKRLWQKYYGDDNTSESEQTKEESVSEIESTSESTKESETTSETSKSSNDGLTIDTAFTVDELLDFMKDYQDKQISSQKYYVTGVIATSTYNSTHESYTAYFKDHEEDSTKPVCVYSGTLDSSITDKYTATNALKDATVTVYGYLELFSGKYEIPYLASKYSPSGNAEEAIIKSITGGTKDDTSTDSDDTNVNVGDAGTNATFEGSLPSSYKTITIDFNTNYSQIDMPTENYGTGEVTIDGLKYGYINSKISASNEYIDENYLRLNSKDAKATSAFYNVDAIPGDIVGIKVTLISKSASTNCLYEFAILDSKYTSESAVSGTNGDNGKVFNVYATSNFEGSFFAISINQSQSSTGKASWYNGQIVSIEIYYVE